MEPLEFFDANARIGRVMDQASGPACPDGAGLSNVLRDKGIREALVWHAAQYSLSSLEGNALIGEEVRGNPGLYGTWTFVPPETGEVDVLSLLDRMKAERIAAFRIFPVRHKFLPGRVAIGSVVREISRRKIPIVLSLERDMTWETVYRFLEDFPDSTCILADTGIWGSDRYLRPLLKEYPGVYAETSLISLTAGCLESLVRDYGAGRFLFGTGFPNRYVEASQMDLLHSSLTRDEKAAIASGNIRALVGRKT